MANFLIQGQTTQTVLELIKDLMVIYIWIKLTHNQTHLMLIFIMTKFGADWFIFVDVRV